MAATYYDRFSDSAPPTPVSASTISHLTAFDRGLRDALAPLLCPQCYRVLKSPVTLPCGRSVCTACLPRARARPNVSYPPSPERGAGFSCPFEEECGKEHAVDDCAADYVLGMMIEAASEGLRGGEIVHDGFEEGEHVEDDDCTECDSADDWETVQSQPDADVAITVSSKAPMATLEPRPVDSRPITTIRLLSGWDVAGTSTLQSPPPTFTARGSRLQALFLLAALHGLPPTSEVRMTCHPPPSPTADGTLLDGALALMRPEAECQVCYAIFLDPLTTPCGHTLCSVCLHRVLDHTPHCPVCRRAVSIAPLLSSETKPLNRTITRVLETFWPQSVASRRAVAAQEGWTAGPAAERVPIFPCTMAFPGIPLFLHIFEPRYRLMVRRCMEGSRVFGMVLPQWMSSDMSSGGSGSEEFAETGTLVRIAKVDYFPDGRSMIQTTGLARFKICSHEWEDGIIMAKIERITDVSIAEEEAMEAAELREAVEAGRNAPRIDEFFSANSSPEGSRAGSPTTEESPSLPLPSDDPERGRRRANSALEAFTFRNASPDPFSDMPPPLERQQRDIEAMPTADMLTLARASALQTVHVDKMMRIFGPAPDDAALFGWWFAAVMPMPEDRKYQMLKTRSVRGRLKICCEWILDWEGGRWPGTQRCIVM